MILLLASCASTVTPMQPGDVYYEKNLKVEESYIVPPTVLTLGFTFPVGNYKAVMKDDNGTYFAATSPLLAKDWMVGSVYRNGGIYYKTNESAYLYVVDTINFGGARVDNEPLTGLKFKITK